MVPKTNKTKERTITIKIIIYIVKKCSFIAVQNENIISWQCNSRFSRKAQLNAPRIFLDKLE